MSSLETELKALGLNLNQSQLKKIRDLAVKEDRKIKAMPILMREKFPHYLLFTISFSNALCELMFAMEDNEYIRHRLSRNFKSLKKLTRDIVNDFKNKVKDEKEVIDALEAYSSDICEMVYNHIERTNEE